MSSFPPVLPGGPPYRSGVDPAREQRLAELDRDYQDAPWLTVLVKFSGFLAVFVGSFAAVGLLLNLGNGVAAWAAMEVAMTSDARPSSALRDIMRTGVREVSGVWWWFVLLGILWTWFGMFVLSYRVGSLAAVAAFVGVAFLFGGITQLAVASRVPSGRWLLVVAGILGVAPGSSPSSGRASPCMSWRSWWPGT